MTPVTIFANEAMSFILEFLIEFIEQDIGKLRSRLRGSFTEQVDNTSSDNTCKQVSNQHKFVFTNKGNPVGESANAVASSYTLNSGRQSLFRKHRIAFQSQF